MQEWLKRDGRTIGWRRRVDWEATSKVFRRISRGTYGTLRGQANWICKDACMATIAFRMRRGGASPDAELAMQTMLDNEVIFGLEWLTNGLPAFITCTAEALTEKLGCWCSRLRWRF